MAVPFSALFIRNTAKNPEEFRKFWMSKPGGKGQDAHEKVDEIIENFEDIIQRVS